MSCPCAPDTGPSPGSLPITPRKQTALFFLSVKIFLQPVINTHCQAGPADTGYGQTPLGTGVEQGHQGTLSPKDVCALGTQPAQLHACSGCIWAGGPKLLSCLP